MAARMVKHHPVGEVLACEATESNLDDLGEMAGAQRMTSPRGVPYALVESDAGTTRLEVGGYLVQEGEGKRAQFRAMTADEFQATYTR